ncbi:monooxygenase [Corynespora cassiicola Philippines]|uniref:Monooxygenase n=1 Tax=Corynespora cassiicola Philippines TaxID=1448308 RepID=A0A2T2N251_CORCC|nr:monooxygenase [Corynespora cassiicola Philippines]
MLLKTITFSTLAAATALPPRATDSECQNPTTRKEWRTLSSEEKTDYIKAVGCLSQSPSKLGLISTRADDFPYVHISLDTSIHSVASFLPWHRYFVHIYEQSLQECGYKGVMPYWDWTLDSDDPARSPIWDPITGFGGDGTTDEALKEENGRRCLTDGPLKNLRPSWLSPGVYSPHCLSRGFNNGTQEPGDMFRWAYTPESVKEIHEKSAYADFRYGLEGTPHGAIHSAVGGDMLPSHSPNDPIFFLHHAQVDRLWYLWQQEALANRTLAYGGPKTQDQFDGTTPPPASLDDIMPFQNLAKDLAVRDVMSTTSGGLCYKY